MGNDIMTEQDKKSNQIFFKKDKKTAGYGDNNKSHMFKPKYIQMDC